MPLIEELPVATTVKASHGWAYVPDTGPISAQQPGTRDRKRAAASTGRNAASSSAKREKAIQQRLDSLNKENHRDGVSVPLPPSNRDRDKGKKVTSNVRRILAYQRNFAHYLADEEANHPGATHYVLPNVATGQGSMPPPPGPGLAQEKSAASDSASNRRKSGVRSSTRRSNLTENARPATPTEETPRGTKRSRPPSRSKSNAGESSPIATPEAPVKEEEPREDALMSDAPAEEISSTTLPPECQQQQSSQETPDYPLAWDTDPLLRSHPSEVPPMPSRRVMELLVSEPPLTYNAARATPLDDENAPPPRRFCGICGYWGRVKCKKCEEWTCGIMECWRGHDAVCAMANTF